MAEVIGPQTLLDKALPTGVDGTRIAEWALRDGFTYGEVASLLSQALGGFNQEMVSMWGWLFSLTEENFLEYENGGAVSEMPEITDLDDITTLHGTTIGHMLDLKHYGRAIGGSKFYWRDARSAKVMSSVRTIVRQARWRFEKKLLTRWFTNTENSIGSGGYDVPFVRGTGGNVDFAPPSFDGEDFTTSHNHYIGVDSDSKGYDDALNELAEHLQEHGHAPPYTAMVSRADISSYYALQKWIELVEMAGVIIDRGGETTGAQFFQMAEREFGMVGGFQSEYGTIDVRATSRVPTGYVGLTKSYGQLDARNGLAVRVHPAEGFGTYIEPTTAQDDEYPLKKIDVLFEFGVSVGEDRTNGAAAYVDSSGSWSNPSIS